MRFRISKDEPGRRSTLPKSVVTVFEKQTMMVLFYHEACVRDCCQVKDFYPCLQNTVF